MKQVRFGISEMKDMREALDDALQMAVTLMIQKGSSQSSVNLGIELEMDKDDMTPEIKYKTSVSVPMKINNVGREQQAGQIRWDQELAAFVMMIEGEQVKI